MKINFLLLNQLKHHSFYRGKLKTAYEPKLQARLRAGQKLECLDDPLEVRPPELVISSIGHAPFQLFQLTITEQMAKELKVENIKVDIGEDVVYLSWTPACDDAPVVQLCPECRRPLVKSLRKIPGDYYECVCSALCPYESLSEQTREQLRGVGMEVEDE